MKQKGNHVFHAGRGANTHVPPFHDETIAVKFVLRGMRLCGSPVINEAA